MILDHVLILRQLIPVSKEGAERETIPIRLYFNNFFEFCTTKAHNWGTCGTPGAGRKLEGWDSGGRR